MTDVEHKNEQTQIGVPSRAEILAWMTERWENCLRIAAYKTGVDRQGWLEDATYFSAAIGELSRAENVK